MRERAREGGGKQQKTLFQFHVDCALSRLNARVLDRRGSRCWFSDDKLRWLLLNLCLLTFSLGWKIYRPTFHDCFLSPTHSRAYTPVYSVRFVIFPGVKDQMNRNPLPIQSTLFFFKNKYFNNVIIFLNVLAKLNKPKLL